MNINPSLLRSMLHSPVRNYAIPGLTSWLVGNPSAQGVVRFFECSREHQERITPHSHRFDFHCLVLAGSVRNIVWDRTGMPFSGDQFQASELAYQGAVGAYKKRALDIENWAASVQTYSTGEWYGMTADQVHSIEFSRDAQVLFFEGPAKTDTSIILEPWVEGEVIPTFKVEPWMFKRSAA